jgi:hypothetical protein
MGYPASALGPRLRAYDIVQARSIGLADSPLSIAARREFPDSDVVVSARGLSITTHASQYCCTSSYGISRRALRFLRRFNDGEHVRRIPTHGRLTPCGN